MILTLTWGEAHPLTYLSVRLSLRINGKIRHSDFNRDQNLSPVTPEKGRGVVDFEPGSKKKNPPNL